MGNNAPRNSLKESNNSYSEKNFQELTKSPSKLFRKKLTTTLNKNFSRFEVRNEEGFFPFFLSTCFNVFYFNLIRQSKRKSKRKR